MLFLRNHSRICTRYLIHINIVFWEQQGLQLTTKIQISRSATATQPAVERHFRDLVNMYGKQHAINLLSQKEGSPELILTEAYKSHVARLEMDNLVTLTNFDFHLAVKGNQFENLSALISKVQDSTREFGLFLFNIKTREILSEQKGTFRVNCMDCLDRTKYKTC